MFRILVAVLGLAAYGGYNLVTSISPDEQAPAVASRQATAPASAAGATAKSYLDMLPKDVGGFSLESAKVFVADAATAAVGVQMLDIPEVGCSESLISADRIDALLSTLPDTQRGVISAALSSGSTVWKAQVYQGSLGFGLCLPVQSKLIVLPVAGQFNLGDTFDALKAQLPQMVSR